MSDTGISEAAWVQVASLSHLRRKKKDAVEVNGEQIALFYVDGDVFAFRDICIHKERNLHKGLIFQGKVICPGHQWAFDLCTGWVDEWGECQPTYAVKVEDDDVFVLPQQRVRTERPAPEEFYGSQKETP